VEILEETGGRVEAFTKYLCLQFQSKRVCLRHQREMQQSLCIYIYIRQCISQIPRHGRRNKTQYCARWKNGPCSGFIIGEFWSPLSGYMQAYIN